MRSYPKNFPSSAIMTAEHLLRTVAGERLVNDGFDWKASPHVLSPIETASLIGCFGYIGASDDDLSRLVDIAFSRVAPGRYFQFKSDGYFFFVKSFFDERKIVIAEQPEFFHGYRGDWRQPVYRAALRAVHSLIELRLADFRSVPNHELWPIGDYGGADLVYGVLYRMIVHIGGFGYCRTSGVMEFFLEAVPDFRQEWEAAGLKLVPHYNIGESSEGYFMTLRLIPR
ncbi:hypothetical protein KBC99_00350 [Candidatus Saccharibacteria bacterium]|nr:hypothetical protein [Candidatus Saccharibacteria bacterium]